MKIKEKIKELNLEESMLEITGSNRILTPRALAVIRRKLDPEMIGERQGGFGKMLQYIHGDIATELLYDAFYDLWMFEVDKQYYIEYPAGKTKEDKGITFISKCSLTIFQAKTEIIIRKATQVGTNSAVNERGYDTAAKGSITDAKKKCMTELGFATELYPNSSNNPVKWKRITSTLSSDLKVAAKTKFGDNDMDTLIDLMQIWSAKRFGLPIVYTNKNHLMHLYPSYMLDFINWIKTHEEEK